MIEIKTYQGEARELANFVTPVWRETFAGKRLTLDWSADFFDWQLLAEGQGNRDYLLAAYDGAKLVGTLLGEPFRFWAAGYGEFDAAMGSWLTVDPQYRRAGIGLKLGDEMRRRLRERNAAFLMGFGISGTAGYEYWQRMPDTLFLGEFGCWCRVFDAQAVIDCSYTSISDRMILSLLRTFQSSGAEPSDHDGVRGFQPEDLARCYELNSELKPNVDVSCLWTQPRLARQLKYKQTSRTVVYEEGREVCGFINYHKINFVGRGTLKAALIDLMSLGSMSHYQRKKLLRAAMAQMIEEGVAMALILRVPCHSTRLMCATGFVPLPREFYALATFSDSGISLRKTRQLHVYLR